MHLYQKYILVLPADRLTGVEVGVSDVEPRDQQEMTPAEHFSRSCGQVTRPVGAGEKITVMCPPGGVIGRYLIIQTRDRIDYLTLCEVEAGEKPVLSLFIATPLSSVFRFYLQGLLTRFNPCYSIVG